MACGCPQGYTYNENTGLCERVIITDVTLKLSPAAAPMMCVNPRYMWKGTAVFPEISTNQFPLNFKPYQSNPTFTDALGENVVMKYQLVSGDLWVSLNSGQRGRFNQAGIGLQSKNDWQGFSRCVTIKSTDNIWVALSATYAFRLYVDGQLAIYNNPSLPDKASDYLFIFPIVLSEGDHSLLFEGLSGNGSDCLAGGFVCEIYNNVTTQILSDCLSQDDLIPYYMTSFVNGVGSNITTLLMRGNPTDTGEKGNYVCYQGAINNCDEGRIVCKYLDQVVPGTDCCFYLTNCVTGVVTITDTNLITYLNKVIVVVEIHHGDDILPGCHMVTMAPGGCVPQIKVAIVDFFENCDLCTNLYYALIDCIGVVNSIVTTTDLSAYVGKTIKIQGYNVCWTVLQAEVSTVPQNVTVVSSFNTCEDCI